MDDQHDGKRCRSGFSRRGFLTTVGAGAAAASLAGRAQVPQRAGDEQADGQRVITLNVNGNTHRLLVEPRWPLLFVLRERLGLTGTKVGCERGECGACTVLIDGVARYACLTLAVEAEGHEVTTLEGLMEGEELGTVQQAFLDEDAYQCGYCTPGQIMAAEGLLRVEDRPDTEQIRRAMSGNLCRCGAYPHIAKAVERAAGQRARQGGGR
jgi:xanthine dehydrogenase YagT iron-sulfur-binding subunit